MAPRIRNISADELRRLFKSPEIASPGLTTADAINLQTALEARRKNALAEEKSMREEIIAFQKEQRDLKAAETEQQRVDILAEKERQAVAPGLFQQAQEDINPAQAGAEEGPLEGNQFADIEAKLDAAEAEVQLDPQGHIEANRAEAVAENKLQADIKLIQERARQSRITSSAKDTKKSREKQNGISALGKSKIFATEGFQNLVTELTAGEKAVPKSVLGRLGVKLDSFSGGNLSELINKAGSNLGFKEVVSSNTEAIQFDQQRESLAVAVYKFMSGDVGNIAASESKRALKLIPSVMDSNELRATKVDALQRAAERAKAALRTLINDPESALLTPEQLRTKQIAIVDEALMSAALNIPDQPSARELFEASQEGQPTAAEQEGLSPEEAAELERLEREEAGQ